MKKLAVGTAVFAEAAVLMIAATAFATHAQLPHGLTAGWRCRAWTAVSGTFRERPAATLGSATFIHVAEPPSRQRRLQ
jgi:hypothetical protein